MGRTKDHRRVIAESGAWRIVRASDSAYELQVHGEEIYAALHYRSEAAALLTILELMSGGHRKLSHPYALEDAAWIYLKELERDGA